jgi:hypothetical protein
VRVRACVRACALLRREGADREGGEEEAEEDVGAGHVGHDQRARHVAAAGAAATVAHVPVAAVQHELQEGLEVDGHVAHPRPVHLLRARVRAVTYWRGERGEGGMS